MTKISQYSTDNNIRGNDKWIGSDSQNFLMTKNFTPNSLADYFNGNNVIDIGTSIRYTYQTLDPGELRAQGTISFETEIGPQVNFSDITTFLLAKNTLKGNTVSQYLDLLVDSKVLLSKSSNINVYGYYKITSIEPWIPDTNFFVVTVDFLSGNGFIYEDLDYLISLVDKVSALPSTTIWGDITGDILNQTDLIDYIADNTINLNSLSAGTGISYNNLTGVITNSAPDQTVVLTAGTNIGITGTYPNFTINNTQSLAGYATETWVGLNYYPLSSNPAGYITSASVALQTSYTNSVNGTIQLDGTRGSFKVRGVSGVSNTIESYLDSSAVSPTFYVSPVGTVYGAGYFYGNSFCIPFNQGLRDNSNTVQFIAQSDGITAQGRWESNQRINYLADYSALYSDRSLIDKGYADATYMPISGGGGGIPHTTASGTDTYTASITGVTSYADGDAYLVRFTNGNTTSCTLNINSLGAIPLYRNNDGALIGGDIVNNGEMLCVYNSTLNVFQTIGTAPNTLLSYVTNADSVTITKGQVVYAFGGQGDRMTVKLASNSSDSTSARTVGVVLSASIGVNQKGLIMMQGLLDGLSILPTSTWSDGDPVYLGATPGSITKVKPYAPNHLVYVATVTTASNGAAGRMYVNIQNGYELDELHNVQAQSPSLNDTLWYDSSVSPGQWKTASIPTILGYTPVTNARTLTINGTALDLSADRSWSVGTVTSVAALTLGTSGTDLSSSVATGTTTPVITLNVPTASATNRGVLSSADWTTFNNKQNALSYTPYKYLNTTQTSLTGTLSETIMATATINPNTFNSNDVMKMLFKVTKSTTASAVNMRIRINTSNTLSGATQIGIFSLTTSSTYHLMQRNFDLSGGTLYGYNFASSLISDITAVNTVGSSTTYNTASIIYVFFTLQLGNVADTCTFTMAYITN